MAEFATNLEMGGANGAPRASQQTAGQAPSALIRPSLAAPATSDSGESILFSPLRFYYDSCLYFDSEHPFGYFLEDSKFDELSKFLQ